MVLIFKRNLWRSYIEPLAQLYCGVYSDEGCYIIVAVHHAIIDGWSFQLFIDQLFDYLDEAVDQLS